MSRVWHQGMIAKDMTPDVPGRLAGLPGQRSGQLDFRLFVDNHANIEAGLLKGHRQSGDYGVCPHCSGAKQREGQNNKKGPPPQCDLKSSLPHFSHFSIR